MDVWIMEPIEFLNCVFFFHFVRILVLLTEMEFMLPAN